MRSVIGTRWPEPAGRLGISANCEEAAVLTRLESGNRVTLDAMMPALYRELRRLAEACMRRERSDHTLQPTALVNEVYMRLAGQRNVDWRNRAQVLGVAARMMRRVLLNYAETRNAAKRPTCLVRVSLDDSLGIAEPAAIEYLDIEQALGELSKIDPQQGHIVELRFFGGLTTEETAEVIGLSASTVERKWATARLWLLRRLSGRGLP
jgi:RNA polymerase sigma-70 factor, ECF subfamily